MDWTTLTIRLQDEPVQQAIAQLFEEYERENDPVPRLALEVAVMRWLGACVRSLLEGPAYYTLGTNMTFTAEWDEQLQLSSREHRMQVGPFAPGAAQPPSQQQNNSERAAALARHLVQYGWVVGSGELQGGIAYYAYTEGLRDMVLITCPSEEVGMTLYQLRRPNDLGGVALEHCVVQTVQEAVDIESTATIIGGGQHFVADASRRVRIAEALARRGLGDHVLLTYPLDVHPEHQYYNLFPPGYRTDRELHAGWTLQVVSEIAAVKAPA